MSLLDVQISYIRLLVGDNSRTDPFYTDSQIAEAATIGPARPPLPIDLRVCGTIGFIHYPEIHQFPSYPAGLSLAGLTDTQLAALTDGQLATIRD